MRDPRSASVHRQSAPALGAFLFVALATLALGARCSGDGLPVNRGGTGGVIVSYLGGRSGTGGVSDTCVGVSSISCASGSPLPGGGLQCGDSFFSTVCDGHAWVCPGKTVPLTQCRCFQDCGGMGGQSGTGGGAGGYVEGGTGGLPGKGTGGVPVSDAGPGCSDGPVVFCAKASSTVTGGLVCDSVAFPASCTNGAWVCPTGSNSTAQCTCYAPSPLVSCLCTASGWTCPDAAADSASASDGPGPDTSGSVDAIEVDGATDEVGNPDR